MSTGHWFPDASASPVGKRTASAPPEEPGHYEKRICLDLAQDNHANEKPLYVPEPCLPVSLNWDYPFQTQTGADVPVFDQFHSHESLAHVIDVDMTPFFDPQPFEPNVFSNENCTPMSLASDGVGKNVNADETAVVTKLPETYQSVLQDMKDPSSDFVQAFKFVEDSDVSWQAGSDPTPSLSAETPDTCLGMITTSATTSIFQTYKKSTVSVEGRVYGDLLKLYTRDENKYAGLATEPALAELINSFVVKFEATLIAPPKPSAQSSSKKAEPLRPCSSMLKIIFYGTMKQSTDIASILSKASLYLQHPSASEVDSSVEYFNPHYLVRPGSQMPRLEDLTLDDNKPDREFLIDETTKGQFMKIFDNADDLGISPTTEPSPRLITQLKQHQLTALTIMSEKEVGFLCGSQLSSLWESCTAREGAQTYRHRITGRMVDRPLVARGGILADEMGLGKTLSILSLICWSLDLQADHDAKAEAENELSLATLIITPKSTISGWCNQIERHINAGRLSFTIYHGSDRKSLTSDLRKKDIVITTYDTLRSDWKTQGPLYGEKWFRVVLDEAHHIGNRATQTFQAACAIQAQRRWCLTGTPIQNCLDNYGALLSFIGVEPFVTKSKFDFWISNPIKDQRNFGFDRLQALIRGTCLRRLKRNTIQSCELPDREERIEMVDLNQQDREIYDFFRKETANLASRRFQLGESTSRLSELKGSNNILTLINFLRRICNHGDRLLPEGALKAWKKKKSGLLTWEMMQDESKLCGQCQAQIEADFDPSLTFELSCGHVFCSTCILGAAGDLVTSNAVCSICPGECHEMPIRKAGMHTPPTLDPSAKIEALLRNLRAEQLADATGSSEGPIKSVIFSQWTKMLDLVQEAVSRAGYNCVRLDGKKSIKARSEAMKRFSLDKDCTVMLATTGSAGEGIDMTAANHVHLIEPHWNPMAEAQAIARVHRIGQSRTVIATRYVARGTIEEYVQWIQQDKLYLIAKSFDSQNLSQSEVDDERWKKLNSFLQ